jgi:hypothetical protein
MGSGFAEGERNVQVHRQDLNTTEAEQAAVPGAELDVAVISKSAWPS